MTRDLVGPSNDQLAATCAVYKRDLGGHRNGWQIACDDARKRGLDLRDQRDALRSPLRAMREEIAKLKAERPMSPEAGLSSASTDDEIQEARRRFGTASERIDLLEVKAKLLAHELEPEDERLLRAINRADRDEEQCEAGLRSGREYPVPWTGPFRYEPTQLELDSLAGFLVTGNASGVDPISALVRAIPIRSGEPVPRLNDLRRLCGLLPVSTGPEWAPNQLCEDRGFLAKLFHCLASGALAWCGGSADPAVGAAARKAASYARHEDKIEGAR